jgi:DNA-binding GntR family transcriptional regulator
MTTRRMSPSLLAELREFVVALESEEAHLNFEHWHVLHRRLHRLIVVEAGETLVDELEQLELRSERYQSAYKGAHMLGWWQRGEAEHRGLAAYSMQ